MSHISSLYLLLMFSFDLLCIRCFEGYTRVCLHLFLLLSAALSDRGTVVMEAALSRALSAVDAAVSDRSKAEAGCRGCVPCLFQDCGQRKGACGKLEHMVYLTL